MSVWQVGCAGVRHRGDDRELPSRVEAGYGWPGEPGLRAARSRRGSTRRTTSSPPPGHHGQLAPFDAFWGQRYATVQTRTATASTCSPSFPARQRPAEHRSGVSLPHPPSRRRTPTPAVAPRPASATDLLGVRRPYSGCDERQPGRGDARRTRGRPGTGAAGRRSRPGRRPRPARRRPAAGRPPDGTAAPGAAPTARSRTRRGSGGAGCGWSSRARPRSRAAERAAGQPRARPRAARVRAQHRGAGPRGR